MFGKDFSTGKKFVRLSTRDSETKNWRNSYRESTQTNKQKHNNLVWLKKFNKKGRVQAPM